MKRITFAFSIVLLFLLTGFNCKHTQRPQSHTPASTWAKIGVQISLIESGLKDLEADAFVLDRQVTAPKIQIQGNVVEIISPGGDDTSIFDTIPKYFFSQ